MTEALLPRAGVIGLGPHGAIIATFLAWHGVRLSVFDSQARRCASLVDPGAYALTPRHVGATSDIVFIVDVDDPYRLLLGVNGVLAQPRAGLCVVAITPMSAGELERIAGMCRRRGVEFLHGSVTAVAEDGDMGLAFEVRGPALGIEHAMPVLKCAAQSVIPCGPGDPTDADHSVRRSTAGAGSRYLRRGARSRATVGAHARCGLRGR